MNNPVELHWDGKKISLPLIEGSAGERAIDVSKLRDQTGLITLDNGYGNTGYCESAITFIDGEKGILRYRGIPIEELADESTFVETAFLIIYGKLPTQAELTHFRELLTAHELIHEDMKFHFEGFPPNAHPMAMLSSMITSAGCYYPELLAPQESEDFAHLTAFILSQVRTIAAFAYRKSLGLPFIYPKPEYKYSENFLHMMFSRPNADLVLKAEVVRALDLILLLHADHEQNCSSSAMRGVGSSHVDPYSATAAATAALYGPLHGGANEQVLRMLLEIGSVKNVPAYIKSVKAGEKLLMGFGHRVYKNYDPRARIVKHIAYEVFDVMGRNPLIEIALECERIALEEDYFVTRRLYPNVDFYTGLIYQSMGFPVTMFPVLFAIPRTSGWIAQWEEMLLDPEQKISRPRQVYLGYDLRGYVPLEDRG